MTMEQRHEGAAVPASGKTSRFGRPVVMAVIALCLTAWLSVEREPLLRAAAEAWIVSDPIEPAQVAVVLGGGIEIRPFVVAELYVQGLVKRVLISQVEEEPRVTPGMRRGHTEANRRVLLSLGVPAEAIETFGRDNRNTRDEARALAEWATRHQVESFIIPTEVFAARRVRWTFQRAFDGRHIRIVVPAAEPRSYVASEWWKSQAGILAFLTEISKYLYYRLRY